MCNTVVATMAAASDASTLAVCTCTSPWERYAVVCASSALLKIRRGFDVLSPCCKDMEFHPAGFRGSQTKRSRSAHFLPRVYVPGQVASRSKFFVLWLETRAKKYTSPSIAVNDLGSLEAM